MCDAMSIQKGYNSAAQALQCPSFAMRLQSQARPGRAMIAPVRRIAVFRALQLGDMLVAVPALRALRAGYPEADITLIGLSWAASFAAQLPYYVNHFLSFPGYPGIDEADYDEATTAAFIAQARAHDYDLVIQMHGSGGQSNPFALALGGRVTAGYYDTPPPPAHADAGAPLGSGPTRGPTAQPASPSRGQGERYPSPPTPLPDAGEGVGGEGRPPAGLAPAAPYPRDLPEVQRNLGLVLLLGCPDLGPALEFWPTDQDATEAAGLLEPLAGDSYPLIGIHPGARPPARRWPPERFAAVADDLARRHGARVVLSGGPGEEAPVQAVIEHMRTRPLNVAGRTSLGGLAALIARLDLFIGNDSGPAHLAEAVGTPTVRIFGPADPCRWAPLDLNRHAVVRRPVPCSPCAYWECPIDHRCLRLIEPGDVLRAAENVLATQAGYGGGRRGRWKGGRPARPRNARDGRDARPPRRCAT